MTAPPIFRLWLTITIVRTLACEFQYHI